MTVRTVKLDQTAKPTKVKKSSGVAEKLATELHDKLAAVAETCNALKAQGCDVEFRFDPANGKWDFTYIVKRVSIIGSK
jgi:hypothetical protein